MAWGAALRRFARDRRGTTAVEFGFVGLAFVTLMLGAVDFGRYQFTQQSLRDISAAAARTALIDAANHATPMSDAALKTAVTTPNLTPFLTPATLGLTTTRTSANGVHTITVNVNYPFQFVAPVMPTAAITMTDTASLSY